MKYSLAITFVEIIEGLNWYFAHLRHSRAEFFTLMGFGIVTVIFVMSWIRTFVNHGK